ncbi:MAG: hypothetical protein WA441_02135 [Methyloceanibacter sp.]|jgi:hypothetical protein
MIERTALCRLFTLAALLAASSLLGWPAYESHAGDLAAPAKQGPGATSPVAPRDAVIGGYSTTLSEIWGPPEMPPAPKDFGPHFDFPPQPLEGGLLHDPYPN